MMPKVGETHPTKISLSQAPPTQLFAGTEIVLKIRVSCSHGCNLQGKKIRVLSENDSPLKEAELREFTGDDGNLTEELKLLTPLELGEATWQALFPFCEGETVRHEESHIRFSFQVLPHQTSIAVWDIPSPAILKMDMALKVGVKCSAGCNLAGEWIEIQDHEGKIAATGVLGESPWPGSQGLYWKEVSFQTPCREGFFSWEARFNQPPRNVPHQGAVLSFGFRTSRLPEHRLAVEVMDSQTKAPIQDAFIAANLYRAYSDADGRAVLDVTAGTYEIYVWRDGYFPWETTLEVSSHMGIQAELLFVPPGL
jgi:hypothetical protein